MRHVAFSLLLAGTILLPKLASAKGFTCENGRVDVQDSKFEIIQKCGEPTVKNTTMVSKVTRQHNAVTQEFIQVDRWLYNFGADRFIVVLTFNDGNLRTIKNYGYGRNEGEEPDFNKRVEVGDPAVKVLFMYGAPTHREEWVQQKVKYYDDGPSVPYSVHRETWTYNLGHNHFLKILHFTNGRLTRIESGDRGF